MASFTGITAARADEILGMSVVSMIINGSGHLICTRHNGDTFDAGDFTGIVADVLADQVEAAVSESVPDAVAGTLFALGNITGAVAFPAGVNSDSLINALFTATLTGNITINSASLPATPKANTQFAMRLTQDATGGRTLTLTGFKKSFGVLELSTGATDTDVLMFFYDGTSWYAGAMGFDFS